MMRKHRVASILSTLLFLAVPLSAVPAGAQTPVEHYAGKAAPFTIRDIRVELHASAGEGRHGSRPATAEVEIAFDAPCTVSTIQDVLKFSPQPRLEDYRQTDNDRIAVTGDFKPGQKYAVYLPDGFVCRGRKFVKGRDAFTVPDLPSKVAFKDEGSVIERDSRQLLNVSITNVDELQVRALRLPLLLAPAALREARSPASLDKAGKTLEANFAALADALKQAPELAPFLRAPAESRNVFRPGKGRNEAQDFSVPMSFREEKEKGAALLVQAESVGEGQKAASPLKVLRVSDLGLACKKAQDTLFVWTTSIRTADPIAGVSLLAATSDGHAIFLGKTGKDGTLLVKDLDGKKSFRIDGKPGAPRKLRIPDIACVLAATGADGSFLEINEGVLVADWIGPGEPMRIGDRLFRGSVFTERGIYRPGDTVHFKGTVRGYRNGTIAPPDRMDVTWVVLNSKQEEIFRKTAALSEFGTAADSLAVQRHFPLGTYTVRMEPKGVAGTQAPPAPAPAMGGDEGDDEGDGPSPAPAAGPAIGTIVTTFEVQEFRQPRHFTSIHFRKRTEKDDSYVNLSKETAVLECEIAGSYYAGGGVKNGKVRWKIAYAPTSFRPNGYREFTFGSAVERQADILESGETVLDGKGKAVVALPLSAEVLSGSFAVEMTATVVDFDGRAASGTGAYQEDPPVLVGISSHDAEAGTGDSHMLKIVVLDRNGRQVERGRVTAFVLRKQYVYTRKRNEQGHIYWQGENVFRKQATAPLALKDGQAQFEFDFQLGGEYLLKFAYQAPDGREYSSSTQYTVRGPYYGWETDTVRRPFEKLSAAAGKKTYAPGETARIYVNPHRKITSLLVTVERESVIESRVVAWAPGQKFLDVPLGPRHAPNVYVSLLGVGPRGEFPVYTGGFDDEAPAFLYGSVPIEVREKPAELRVTINGGDASLRALPGEERTLRFAVKDAAGAPAEAEMAVAVVDESVLALTGFRTPSLDALARFLVPLSVSTAELRSRLLLQTPFGYVRAGRLTGGDGSDESAAVTSKLRKDFNPVAYFNPAVRTGPDGTATVTFRLPDSMTAYRVYAVTCDKGSAFASTQKQLVVTKDFYLEPGTPSFLTKGDRFTLLVSAFNKTKEKGTGTFRTGTDPCVALSGAPPQFELPAMDRLLLPVKGEAVAPGTARLSFSGTLGERRDAVEIRVPVNSGLLLWNDIVSGTMKGAATIRYAFPKGTESIPWKDVHPDEVKALLAVSGSPFMRMAPALRYLLHYPYGCVEQTSSTVIPLAALRGLIKDGLLPGITVEETDKFIRPGVERLLKMQVDNGGFAYWPGYREVHPWGAIYAMTALTFAKRAGLQVPEDRFRKGLDFLAESVKGGGQANDDAYAGYASYLLALNGRLSRELFDVANSRLGRMPREAALLTLLAAHEGRLTTDDYLRSGARNLLERPWDSSTRSSFWARYREPAVALLVGTALFPEDPVTGKAAAELQRGINPEGYWSSTSDTGWSLLALGEYFRGKVFSRGPVTVTVRQQGGKELTATLESSTTRTFELDAASFLARPEVSVTAGGNGTLNYQLAVSFPRVDLARTGHSNGFRVAKSVVPLEGGTKVKVGDIVKVEVTFETGFHNMEYVVVDDPLPAGLVAINSALKTEDRPREKDDAGSDWGYWDYEWGMYRFYPNHFELRDDRVLAFRNRLWGNGKYRYSYYARAVLAGEFVLPATKVQLMYEPNIVGYTPVQKFVIEER